MPRTKKKESTKDRRNVNEKKLRKGRKKDSEN